MYEPDWEDTLLSILLDYMGETPAWDVIDHIRTLKYEWQREVSGDYDDDDFLDTFYGSDYGGNG